MRKSIVLGRGARLGIVGLVLAAVCTAGSPQRADAQGVPGIGPTAPPSLGPTYAPNLGPTAPPRLGPTAPPRLGPSMPRIGPTVPSLPRPIYNPPPRFPTPSVPPQVRWYEQRAATERAIRSSQMAVHSHNQAQAWQRRQAGRSQGHVVVPGRTSRQPVQGPFWRLRRLIRGW